MPPPPSDPQSLAAEFAARLRARDIDGALDCLADDALVAFLPAPPPPLRAVASGRAEIDRVVRQLAPGFALDPPARARPSGGAVWEATLGADIFRRLGIERVAATIEGEVRDGRLARWAITLSPDDAARLQASV